MSRLAWDEIDQRAVDTARILAADAVEKAGHDHPGGQAVDHRPQIEHFAASADGTLLLEKLGITPAAVVTAVHSSLAS
ncbi:hypothetical protein [Microbacterium sp.]|uniref:hypothetical protein n=1 Tax=Microbacterium sp. TaxID=51671 RepID=UPI003C71E87F